MLYCDCCCYRYQAPLSDERRQIICDEEGYRAELNASITGEAERAHDSKHECDVAVGTAAASAAAAEGGADIQKPQRQAQAARESISLPEEGVDNGEGQSDAAPTPMEL